MAAESLACDSIEALVEEFLSRKRRGEQPNLEEYIARCPDQRERIEQILETMLLLEDVGRPRRDHIGRLPPRLGEYRLVREVGRGGMGVVYEAIQEPLGRRVALKVLSVSSISEAGSLARFAQEAKTAARLHHTHIVPVYGVGADAGFHYFAMQFIEGAGCDALLDCLRVRVAGTTVEARAGSTVTAFHIADRLWTGAPSQPAAAPPTSPLSPASRGPDYYRRIATIGRQAADALAYAHAHGVVHRDVKPANLLLDSQGSVFVGDFGLAKADDSGDLTRTGMIVGTPRYMAPERFDGGESPQSDVYGLGATLYELIALEPPFGEDRRDRLLLRIQTAEPEPLRKRAPGAPRDLVTIVQKAMTKEPARRYASAAAMADDLSRFLEGRPIAARPLSVGERLLRWSRRHPLTAGLASSLAVTIIVALVFVTAFWRDADANWRMAESHAADARDKGVEAAKQRDRARVRLATAMDAISRFYTRVSEGELATIPGAQRQRLELLEEANRYLTSFVQEAESDPNLLFEVGRTHVELAKFQRTLGKSQDARLSMLRGCEILEGLRSSAADDRVLLTLGSAYGFAAAYRIPVGGRIPAELYRQGREMLEGLLPRASSKLDVWRVLAKLLNAEAQFWTTCGEFDRAEELFRRSRRLAQTASENRPLPLTDAAGVARDRLDLANLLSKQGRRRLAVEEAEAAWRELRRLRSTRGSSLGLDLHFARAFVEVLEHRLKADMVGEVERDLPEAVTHVEQLAGANREDSSIVVLHSKVLLLKASLLGTKPKGDFDAAIDECYRSLEACDRHLRKDPACSSVLSQRATVLLKLNTQYIAQEAWEESLAASEDARQALTTLVESTPEEPGFVHQLGGAVNNLAMAQRRLGLFDEAEKNLREAIRWQRKAMSMSRDPAFATYLGRHLLNLSRTLRESGRASEAYSPIAECVESLKSSRSFLFECGIESGLCYSVVAAKRGTSADRFGALAVVALDAAVDAGINDLSSIKSRTELELVRKRSDFAAALRKWEANPRVVAMKIQKSLSSILSSKRTSP